MLVYLYIDKMQGRQYLPRVAIDFSCDIINEYRGNNAEDATGGYMGGVLTTLIKYELVDILGKAQWKASVNFYRDGNSGLETQVSFADTQLQAGISAVDLAWFNITQSEKAEKCS